MTRWYLTETDYPAVRRVMGSGRDHLSDEALEHLLERMFPGAEAEYVEDFMRTLQQFGRQAAPIVQKVGPGMAQGALQGGMVAGPWGALAGALGGGAASLLGGGGRGAAPARAPAPAAPQIPGGLAPIAPQAPAGGVGGAASAQLLTLLSRPETMQALLSLVMAQSGRGTVPVGQHQVPAVAFANAISELASEAALSGGESSGYWFDPHGAPRCDLASPSARAALLWGDLAEAAEAEAADWDQQEGESMDLEEADDALASFETALQGD